MGRFFTCRTPIRRRLRCATTEPVNRRLFSAQGYLNGKSNILVCLLFLKSTRALFTLKTVSTPEEPSQTLYILTEISQENIFRLS